MDRRHALRIVGLSVAALLAVACVAEPPPSPPAAQPTPLATRPSPAPTAPSEPSPTAPATPVPATPVPATPVPATAEVPTPVMVTIGTPATNETLFLPDEATVPSGAEVVLTFDNASTLPHNVTFDAPIDAGTAMVVDPGESDGFSFTAPAPGEYEFICTLHPWMTGTLVVTDGR